ncbi:MAG: selenide, water dikinase SelD [Pseudomonadota bacterium]
MNRQVPLTQDLVLIGGGHAHALVLRSWGMDPLPGARLTVINPAPTAPYTGMLPGHIAGHYPREALEIDLVRLCRHAGARLILDRAVGLDRARGTVHLAARGPAAYDVASIDIGITAQMDLPGFKAHAVPAKPLDGYAARWRAFLSEVAAGRARAKVAVIGGGVAGCELAMAMAHALRAAGTPGAVTLIEAKDQISGMGQRARVQVLRALEALGVELRLGAEVRHIAADHVALTGQDPVPAAFTVGAAGAFPQPWLADTDLPLRAGFIEVGRDLGVRGDARLFAVGDCAVMPADPRPKAGVFAVRAAPVLHQNLRAALGAGYRRRWRPQKDYLKLISLGGKSALGEKFGMALAGPALWQWKDRIDQAFMRRLRDLPPMPQAEAPVAARGVREMMRAQALCGGCGSKVGSATLRGALSLLPDAAGEVVAAAGDDAAILRRPGGGFQVISTDHLRAVVADPVEMTRIAAVHALGDVWAMGARPQVALCSVILPQMSAALQARTLSEITQTAQDLMASVGAQVVGGHTSMGAEFTIGFTVIGAREVMPLTVAGAAAGDRLILTRPIGAGVLLAAEMQGRAAGGDIAALLSAMTRPQDRAAEILAGVARAMTDVTGFGLAGHAQMLARAAGLDAHLNKDAIPLYQGARALSDAGVASTLMPSNKADAPVLGRDDPLLYDPQTAGGLLAAVPAAAVAPTLAALSQAGCRGALIGEMKRGAGRVHLK